MELLSRGFPGGSLWTILLEMCSIVGELTPISIDGGSPMSTITQRIASAFVVLSADTATSPGWRTTESNRGNRFTARPVRSPMLSTAPQSVPHRRTPAATRRAAGSIQDLQERLEHAIEITRDNRTSSPASPKPRVSAWRGAAAVAGRGRVGNYPERADVGTGHRGSWPTRRPVARVIDEVAQPKVKQATADEIFLGPNRS